MRFVRKFGALVITSLIFLLVVYAWLHRLDIYDDWRLRNYHPPQLITQLAADTTMDDKAQHIFYAQHPEIVSDKATFNSRCQVDEQTIVLGCYVSRTGIYVFDVQDTRLTGVAQVTAAHEMLHAAYDRLSSQDKKKIDTMITETYAKVTDKRVRGTIDQYKKAGADITNELHSILGTEVRILPSSLETYYRRYFTDRSKIVSYSEQYEQAFTDRTAKVEAYTVRLAEMKTQIDADKGSLDNQLATLNAQSTKLNQLLSGKDYATYNAGVPVYNAAIRNYNALVGTTREHINAYNTLLDEREALSLEEQELFRAIDSHLTTKQSK